MKALSTVCSWLWRLGAAGAVHAVGLALGGALATALGLEPVRSPAPVDPTTATLLLLPAGAAIALGLAVMASGLQGRRWQRWAILGSFAFVVNGAGTAIEATLFTTLGGGLWATFANLPASLLCALAVVLLFPAPSGSAAAGAFRSYLSRWSPGRLAGRLLLALLAFPFLYLLFGMLIAPIVTPHYERLDFLVLPSMPTILSVLLLRSALFLLVSIPVVVYWRRSRGRLALALGVGHFTAVGLSGLLQATFFPAVMRWTHGIEILADSVFYGLALAWLLFLPPPAIAPAAGAEPDAGRRSGARRVVLFAVEVLALTIVLMLVSALSAWLFLGSAPAAAGEPPVYLPAVAFGVLLLQTAALAYAVARSRWGGWRLTATVSLIYFGTASFLGLIETVVYPAVGLPDGMLQGLLMMSAFTAVVFSPILVLTLGKGRAPGSGTLEASRRLEMPAASLAWRLAAGAAIYLALYYVFGYFVAWKQPSVREFYGGSDPGTFLAQISAVAREAPWMLPFQYLRGLLWVLLALPVIRMMRGRRWETGLALSLLFAVPALYLLLPNPVMPEPVRMIHLVETLPYQFLFGWLLAWLFVPRETRVGRRRVEPEPAPA